SRSSISARLAKFAVALPISISIARMIARACEAGMSALSSTSSDSACIEEMIVRRSSTCRSTVRFRRGENVGIEPRFAMVMNGSRCPVVVRRADGCRVQHADGISGDEVDQDVLAVRPGGEHLREMYHVGARDLLQHLACRRALDLGDRDYRFCIDPQ